jgi:hypothetical protein
MEPCLKAFEEIFTNVVFAAEFFAIELVIISASPWLKASPRF